MYHINKLRRKKPYDISIDAGKAFDKIQHLILIKTLSRLTIKITSSIWYRAPVENLKLTSCLVVKDWMFYPSDRIQQLCIIFGLSHRPFWIIVLIGSFVLSLWETVAVFKKLNTPTLLGIYQREKWKYLGTQRLNHIAYGSFICNSQILGTTQMAINRWMNKQAVVPIQWASVQIHVDMWRKASQYCNNPPVKNKTFV